MKITTNIINSIKNTGFSSVPENSGTRLVTKDGQINTKRTGLSFSQRFSIFHWLINMSWMQFFTFIFVGYVMVNTAFAILYVICGIDGLTGTHPPTFDGQFLDAFYFSSQTLTTLGYGAVSPVSTSHNIIATLESFLGLLSFATTSGLLYGRFSKPKAKMLFTKNALISSYKTNERGLMVRLVNRNDDQLINVNASLILSWLDDNEGKRTRRFKKLDLEISHIDMLATSWTVVHPISENSPFIGWSKETIKELKVEMILQIDAYDQTYAQQIHTRTSYRYDEFIWGAKFRSVLGSNEAGQSILKLDKFDDYDLAPLT
ncbi:MAG: inward rectifier potassium channel [Salibacteraceae bacterium]|jgi:inward rectifier potassium channel